MAARFEFEFKNMDVYRLAVGFFAWAVEVSDRIPPGRRFIADQWLRAALSILNNIGEGALEYSPDSKANYYRIARRSGGECAAMLDVLLILKVIDQQTHREQESVLARICAMLTKLARRHETEAGTPSPSTSPSPSTRNDPRRKSRARRTAPEPTG